MQHIAIMQSHSPFNQAKARESLDLILALAAVDYQLSVIFSGDAVYQLLPTDTSNAQPVKALGFLPCTTLKTAWCVRNPYATAV